MKPVLIYFLLIVTTTAIVTSAQDTTLQRKDSLQTILHSQTGAEKVRTLDQLFDFYLSNNIDSAQFIVEQMLKLSARLNDPELKALSFKNNGMIYMNKSQYKKAEQEMFKAIALERQNNLSLALGESYRMLAGIYFNKGDLNNAADYLSKALTIFQKEQNPEGMIMCLNNLGLLNKGNGAYKNAIKNFKSALKIISDNKMSYNKMTIYTNMGVAFRYLKAYDSSYYYQRKALEESLKNLDLKTGISNYHNMAKLFMELRQKDSVNYYLNKAIDLAQKKFPDYLSALLTSKGKWYYKTGQNKKAVEILKKALQLGYKNHNMNDKEYALYYLYKTHLSMKKYPEAIKYLEDLVDVQDSIKMRESLVKITRLEEKYENEKKQLQIEQLKKVQALDKRIKYLLGLIIVGILLIFIIIVVQLRKKHLRNQAEKERIEEDLRLKTKQLTSQALMMMQKNTLLNDILQSLSEIKNVGTSTQKQINELKRKLRKSMHSEEDWELFKQYFEMVNKEFFSNLLKINNKLTSSEMKLAALIKLKFNIKEAATLLNISPDSVKSVRYTIRKKLGLKRQDNLYDFLNRI